VFDARFRTAVDRRARSSCLGGGFCSQHVLSRGGGIRMKRGTQCVASPSGVSTNFVTKLRSAIPGPGAVVNGANEPAGVTIAP